MAGAFALATAAALDRPANAGDKVELKFLQPDRNAETPAPPNEKLPPAGDYTAYNKVIEKPGYAAEKVDEIRTPGSVDANPAVVITGVVFSTLLAGAVPAVLSPGEKAFQAQRAGEQGQRKTLTKNRQQIKKAAKKQWWGR